MSRKFFFNSGLACPTDIVVLCYGHFSALYNDDFPILVNVGEEDSKPRQIGTCKYTRILRAGIHPMEIGIVSVMVFLPGRSSAI